MAKAVVDSSVILACLNREMGFEAWLPWLDDAACSANIIAEVATKLVEKDIPADRAALAIAAFEFAVHPVDYADALAIGALHSASRSRGLSLGDRSCLVLAQRLGLPAVTADRAWSDVADAAGVIVLQIR